MLIRGISIKNPSDRHSKPSSQVIAQANLKIARFDKTILSNFNFNPQVSNQRHKKGKSLTKTLKYRKNKPKSLQCPIISAVFSEDYLPPKNRKMEKETSALSKRQPNQKISSLFSQVGALNLANCSKLPTRFADSQDQFYKRDKQEQSDRGGRSNNMSFSQRFAFVEAQERTLTYQMRKIKRLRNVAGFNWDPRKSCRIKTEYHQEDSEHGDSFIFRQLRESKRSEGTIEIQKLQLKRYEAPDEEQTAGIENIMIPKYLYAAKKAEKDTQKIQSKCDSRQRYQPLFKKNIGTEKALGLQEHPYSCLLKLPRRTSYKKFNSICKNFIESTKIY